MSEENKQQSPEPKKGGAHVAKTGAGSAVPPGESGNAENTPKRNKYADKMNKKKGKLNKKLQIGIGVLIVALLVILGIFLILKTREAGTQSDSNTMAVAYRGMLETYVEGSGVTAAQTREELGKDLKGKVSEVLVSVGDEVMEGDPILVVNPTETRKELETAQEELVSAQRGVSDAQAEVSRAQSEVNAAQKRLNRLTITAPFTGKLIPNASEDGSTETYRVGQQVGEGTVIGYMVDDSKMNLSLYFSSAYLGDIKAGQTASVSIPSAMSAVTGTVSSVENAQKISAEGVKLFRVNISLNNPGTLTKGMLATATVSTSSSGEVYPAESGTLEYSREEAVTVQTGGEIKAVNGIDYYSYKSGATIMVLTSDTAQGELKLAQNGVVTAQNAVVSAQK
ncbi:MAG: efflux RND transporter periplasmic adaptor subunit, partial [Agathobaculum sp.]|uniref:efflux RND transporter periplasmic adaptor subunit n=1 Tax=Agathobaculum sp. TaxID=2048138 RepID=UPI003D8EA700